MKLNKTLISGLLFGLFMLAGSAMATDDCDPPPCDGDDPGEDCDSMPVGIVE